MNTDELDYQLPPQLIAQHGLPQRARSRLLVLHRRNNKIEHRCFSDLPGFFQPGDCLIVNDSKVIPARFFLRRASGGRLEALFLNLDDRGRWSVLLKNASRLRPDEVLTLCTPAVKVPSEQSFTLTVEKKLPLGLWLLRPDSNLDYLKILQRYGQTPLPPYIHRTPEQTNENTDRQRYQTVYATVPGSVAAPTAGLHFTNELLKEFDHRNINVARLTLHVGLGTFKPITTEKIEDHLMHPERYRLDKTNADLINQTIENGSRVIAVGTTVVRTLETLAQDRRIQPGSGQTNLLITPPYEFQIVSALLTNFHLPRTTLLALVCAFAETETVLSAYRQAVKRKYRFYSYGDAMLLL